MSCSCKTEHNLSRSWLLIYSKFALDKQFFVAHIAYMCVVPFNQSSCEMSINASEHGRYIHTRGNVNVNANETHTINKMLNSESR